MHVQYRCKEPITLFGSLNWRQRALIGAQWLVNRSGKGATNHYETGAFLKSGSRAHWPDLQLHFVPIVYNNSVERRTDCHGFRVHAGPVRSASEGFLSLASRDPLDPPRIQPRYFSEPADWTEMRAAISLSREIFAQAPFAEFRGSEISPGPDARSETQLDQFIRETGDTGYHPAGTCRMGSLGNGVVDHHGRVRGVSGLRVVDASIMPYIVSGNLNAAVMMMAEKVSDSILEKDPLPREQLPVFRELN